MSGTAVGAEGVSVIAGRASRQGERAFRAVDPRTAQPVGSEYLDATEAEVGEAVAAAVFAAPALAAARLEVRARLLEEVAARLEELGDTLLDTADAETALGRTRLEGERGRTCSQLRAFAAAVRDGFVTEATVDHGPPDVRRLLVPLGPVGVFGASNFPLAFSTPGGDTASAFAAGCPVVVKGHPAHPATSELAAWAITAALDDVGLPAGCFSLVHGSDPAVSRALVTQDGISAVGFTGSERAGRALMDLAAARPAPIPVFAEMGSLNPLVVTSGAIATRGGEIATGLAGSVTQGTGQFCTKPGLVLHVADDAWDRELVGRLSAVGAQWMLGERLRDGLHDTLQHTQARPGVEVLLEPPRGGDGITQSPAALRVSGRTLREDPELLHEHFGPVTVVVSCDDEADLLATLEVLPGSLTGSLHAQPEEAELARAVLARLSARAGRVVLDGYPTGVAVVRSMHHGGPYPAGSFAGATSVGLHAVRRFQRAVAYQDVRDELLPPVLQDANPEAVGRWVDGAWLPG